MDESRPVQGSHSGSQPRACRYSERGHTVVIPKQHFGIAFLSTGAFAAARSDYPPVASWLLQCHSPGGVVAAADARSFETGSDDALAGLPFFASYPASVTRTLNTPAPSIPRSNDGESTPEKITASRDSLRPDPHLNSDPNSAHSNLGDYDLPRRLPLSFRDEARTQISKAIPDHQESLSK
jgi:hypothetical protein